MRASSAAPRTAALIAWALGSLASASPAAAAPAIEVVETWARATAPGVDSGAAYCKIVNRGPADRLVGARSAAAGAVQIHTTVETAGVLQMKRLEALPVDANATRELAPGATHLMLIGLAAPLVAGSEIRLTLVFENAGDIDVAVPVLDARTAVPAPASHDHHVP